MVSTRDHLTNHQLGLNEVAIDPAHLHQPPDPRLELEDFERLPPSVLLRHLISVKRDLISVKRDLISVKRDLLKLRDLEQHPGAEDTILELPTTVGQLRHPGAHQRIHWRGLLQK